MIGLTLLTFKNKKNMKSLKTIIASTALFAAGTAALSAAETISALVKLDFEKGAAPNVGISCENTGTSNANITNSGGYLNYYTSNTGQVVGNYSYHNSSNHLKISNSGISWTSDWSIAVSFAPDSFDDWANILSVGGTTNHVLVQSKGSVAAGMGFFGAGTLSQNSDGIGYTNSGNISVSAEVLSKIVMVYDYTEGVGGNLFLYVNGEKVSASKNPFNGTDVSTDVYLGAGADGTRRYNGAYDEFAIYNGALSDSQVRNYFSKGDAASPKVVPEPSMFGLLAGLGTLALVAARRRRRK